MANTAKPPAGRLTYAAIALGVVVIGLTAYFLLSPSQTNSDERIADCPAGEECITVHTDSGDHVFTVEWAINTLERTCGLMYREEMDPDHGMVFDFQTERTVSFWMRNTLISLDMVFIRDGGEVLNIAEGTTPLSLEGVPSDGPVRYVFEVVAGTADRIGLEPGDMVDLERAPGMTEGTAVCAVPEE